MAEWVYRCLIVPDSFAAFARELAETIAGSGGALMWTSPLSNNGGSPPSHWISAGLISPQFAALMPFVTYLPDGLSELHPGHSDIAASLASEAGMLVTAEQVQALFDASDVTEEVAQTALARLGLVLASLDAGTTTIEQ